MAATALLPASPTNEQVVLRRAASANNCDGSFLAADIGGTHARLALMTRAPGQLPHMAAYRSYSCADHPHLEDIIRCFCFELDVQPRELVLACAGYVHAGSVINKNLAWPVLLQRMKEQLRFDHVWFLNDLQALAYAVGHGAANDAAVLKAPTAHNAHAGPVVVVGPGTGLGAAVWLPGKPSRVIATEAGHTQLAVRIGWEQRVLAHLAQPDAHVSYEMVLSGPGLHRIYTALCAIHDRYPSLHQPSAVTAAAIAGGDEMAHEALTLFCGWLGSFAADLAMLYGATGGIYLAGGFLFQMTEFLRSSPLLERFLDKGVMRPFLQNIPIRVMHHSHHGVMGAAGWHVDTHSDARTGDERAACIDRNGAVFTPGR
ncbi:glucokinase [Dyella nitratireducens]|uniref:Glucokinase n=1 Tax=Dyella nitratireducens TaxID=1849580 RepID=A0ABQ1GGD6_9GAMM|nr:glucokinase [Dyella nitratireducens]GGA42938.1 glucokinase [Dyella nitratireducens]GLQ41938.1 glucokinase [Dyella nitratireducens]